MKKIKIPIEKAVGEQLEHDLTKIDIDGKFKGAFFKKGHIIRKEDIEELKKIGKNYIYKITPSKDEIHEDDFAMSLSPLLAGENISFSNEPSEGKIMFRSDIDGLFKVDKKRLVRLNCIEETSFPTIHNNFPVKKDKVVAAFRTIPLYSKRRVLERAKKIVSEPIISVKAFKIKSANLIITGNEVYQGLIKDRFEDKIRLKLSAFGVDIKKSEIVPDNIAVIQNVFERFTDEELVVVTGGSSVDPDDVTKYALKKAGVKFIREGNPIQPANNFTIGYLGDITVCVVPAGALYYKASAFDIFIPRILSKDKITKRDIAEYAEGGLCHFCKVCTYPICPFGKA